MFKSDKKPTQSLRSKLRKEENRTRIAECKLDRLKSRFDKIYDDLEESRNELGQQQRRYEALEQELETARNERDRARQESLMWRTQLFERMEKLEARNQEIEALQEQLEGVKGLADHARATHHATHLELQRRDHERLEYLKQIEELQQTRLDSQEQQQDLLDALTGAESAIEALQRSNDLYQREVDGLKAIGASLTEKLTDLTQARDDFKEKYTSSQDELLLVKAHNEHLTRELERLRDELYETKGKLLTARLESDVKSLRKTAQNGGECRDKYAQFPSQESAAVKPQERSLISRATKKMTGWFKLSNSSENLPLSKN